ncbi:MAG: hypothetical protein HS113_23660 [Verrucomicrobiales bacterium]|nr:hypothetical protein [Verrucomicrobiales bacterium]
MRISPKAAWVLAGLLGAALAWRWFTPSPDQALRNRAAQHREIAARVLGESLARQFPARRVIVVSNPFVALPGAAEEIRQFEQAALAGLSRGWGDRIQLLGVFPPALRPEALTHPERLPMDPETKTPLSFLQTDRAWDELLAQHPGADVLVSLIGVPANLAALELWQHPEPVLALLFPDLRMLGGWEGVEAAITSGKLAAVVMERPGSPPASAAPATDDWAEFERRFLLIIAENVGAVRAAYPRLF